MMQISRKVWFVSLWTAAYVSAWEIAVGNIRPLNWTMVASDHQDLPPSALPNLLQCPENFHECSDDPKFPRMFQLPGPLFRFLRNDEFLVTCSCAPNCKVFGDCCWNVHLSELSEADIPRIGCVQVESRSTVRPLPLKMVVGCPPEWTEKDIRRKCEESESFRSIFYRIPVIGTNHVIYRNGFCALCNNDAANATFWNTTRYQAENKTMVDIPGEILDKQAFYMRSCTTNNFTTTCTQDNARDWRLKCNMYYAPVEDYTGVEFKNVYCAMCNGANLSALSCSPERVENIEDMGGKRDPPNLAAIFKPVKRTPTCFAEYSGRCYIKHEADKKEPSPWVNLENTPTTPPQGHEDDEDELSRRYDVEHYLTVVCMSLSIGCLLLKIVAFCAYKNSRNFSSKCTLCLAFTLLFTHILFLITNCIKLSSIGCVVGGVLTHYGFLSTFCWTCTLSYDISKNLTAIKLSSRQNSKLAVYGLFTWGLPLVITASAYTVDRTAPGTALSPGYGNPICWIGTFWSLILYFLIPVAVLLLCCFFFYFRSVSYIRQTSSAAGSGPRELSPNAAEEVRSTQQRNHAALFVRLAMIMCSPWIVAFVGTFVVSQVVDCIVNVLVGLQGAYLFFAFKDYQHFLSSLRKRGISLYPFKGSRTSEEQMSSPKKN